VSLKGSGCHGTPPTPSSIAGVFPCVVSVSISTSSTTVCWLPGPTANPCCRRALLKGLGRKITAAPVNSAERHALVDDLLIELDIHFRIEDDLYYPALKEATKLIAIAHAEHRQVVDQLSVLIKTPQTAPGYEAEWNSFKTVLEAHADEEERDLIPAPPEVHISDAELEELGDKMAAKMEQYRASAVHRLRTKGRAALVRAL